MRGEGGGATLLLPLLLPLLLLTGCLGPGLAVLEGNGPVLELEPPSRVLFSNSSGGRLDCRGGGSPPPSVQWAMADGSAAPAVPGLRYQMPNGSLVFPPFAAADFRPDVHRASYRCVLSSALGRAVSRDVRLTAVVLQHYEVTVSTQPVSRGNVAVLRCVVPSLVREFVAVTSWLQDQSFNIYPSNDGDGKFHMLPTGELFVMNVNQADTFVSYQCRVTHRLTGETKVSARPARITVTEPRAAAAPQLSERSVTVEGRRDEVVVLPCVAQGHPPPEYRYTGNQSESPRRLLTGRERKAMPVQKIK